MPGRVIKCIRLMLWTVEYGYWNSFQYSIHSYVLQRIIWWYFNGSDEIRNILLMKMKKAKPAAHTWSL